MVVGSKAKNGNDNKRLSEVAVPSRAFGDKEGVISLTFIKFTLN